MKTQMAEALAKAGIDKDAMRLAALVHGLIKSGKPVDQQELEIGHALLTDKGMLRAIVQFYRRTLARDKLPGEGQGAIDAHLPDAQSRQPEQDAEGQVGDDSQSLVAPASWPNDDGGGQELDYAQRGGAPSAVAQKPPIQLSKRTLATMGDAQDYARSQWLVTFRASNGAFPMRTPIVNLAELRRRIMREAGHNLHSMVVVRILERATETFLEANPSMTPSEILSADDIARIEQDASYEKVKLKAADWIRKYPELGEPDAA